MKKIIFMFCVMLMTAFGTVANAQESNFNSQLNYASSSKFTDNWSVTLQGGVLTTFSDFYSGHTAMAPVIVLGADKYINPWFGFGIEGRTLIGTGHGSYNSKTAFDAVNVSGYLKVNVLNAISYTGNRRFFEPVVYTGLGWGHNTAKSVLDRNYMTYRAGAELNFNIGKEKAWAVVVNPSVVWGGIDNFKLTKQSGNFEVTAGVVYHFKTSNGSRSIAKARLYDTAEIAAMNQKITDLMNLPAEVKEVVKTVVVKDSTTSVIDRTYVVMFAQGSAQLTDDAKTTLNSIPEGTVINLVGSASVEGTSKFNQVLSQKRADAVAKYVTDRGVKVNKVEAVGASKGKTSNRLVIVTVQ